MYLSLFSCEGVIYPSTLDKISWFILSAETSSWRYCEKFTVDILRFALSISVNLHQRNNVRYFQLCSNLLDDILSLRFLFLWSLYSFIYQLFRGTCYDFNLWTIRRRFCPLSGLSCLSHNPIWRVEIDPASLDHAEKMGWNKNWDNANHIEKISSLKIQ